MSSCAVYRSAVAVDSAALQRLVELRVRRATRVDGCRRAALGWTRPARVLCRAVGRALGRAIHGGTVLVAAPNHQTPSRTDPKVPPWRQAHLCVALEPDTCLRVGARTLTLAPGDVLVWQQYTVTHARAQTCLYAVANGAPLHDTNADMAEPAIG